MERRRRALAPAPDPMAKAVRRRDKPRERWLLTRKTWKYMADAGRRLVPDGAQNRVEDLPRLEAYFQEVCAKEPKYVLWRKSSYPGAIPRPKKKKRPRGGSVRARSPSDTLPPPRPTDLALVGHTSGGRFDIAKLRRDFFATPAPAPPLPEPAPPPEDEEENTLVDLLRKYLKIEEMGGPAKVTGSEELVKALRRFLSRQADRQAAAPTDADDSRTLLETLGRYYGRAPNRDHIVQDLLTDRGLLKRLYHDLRKTKPYRGGRSGGSGGDGVYGGSSLGARGGSLMRTRAGGWGAGRGGAGYEARSPPLSPPPLIEVRGESLEERVAERGTQTSPVPGELLAELERQYRERQEPASPTSPASPPPERRQPRRRSSVDHDDVSQSVSDTIKRYLRMARKKSVDADKADRFKRINYDKNLRNIKPKGPCEGDDDGLNKGSQTDEAWMLSYCELRLGSPASPVSPTAPGFLASLLGRPAPAAPLTAPPSPAGGMHKSRSSSSVVQSVSKRLWGTRSRSSSRAAAAWTPQGSCVWSDGSGRLVRLAATSLLALSDIERRALQQAALARLHQLNLGAPLCIPDEKSSASSGKPKRRAYLIKRKALTTGFFDQKTGKDADKDKEGGAGGAGSVFGVPLSQCVEAERARRRRRQHAGSRASLASLAAAAAAPDDSESCDSGEWGSSVSEDGAGGEGPGAGGDAGGARVPALVSACLAHLRRHGLHTLGLFRVSASKKRVRQLREEWERCAEAALDGAVCPQDVATLLKEFLRDLPDPLLCRDLYAAFVQTQKIRNRRLQWEALRLVVQLLPAAHRDTLSALLAFLAQLAEHAEHNKMDAANLATVIAPNILHCSRSGEAASAAQLAERADVINVVRALIERQAELWALPAELLHDAYLHLASTSPAALDALLLRRADCAAAATPAPATPAAPAAASERRVWSREECLHTAAATGGPPDHHHDHERRGGGGGGAVTSRARRRDASDTSSVSSTRTIVTRVRSSVEESGVVCSPPRDSGDDYSDYAETLCNSDSESCVITASLHIPAAYPRAPPRRRSSGSDTAPPSPASSPAGAGKRDSAVGSSSAEPSSSASSPPASPPPPPAPLRHAHSATRDLDRLMSLAKERNTSDARAVMVRAHDDAVSRRRAPATPTPLAPAAPATLYKRNELISSARAPP